MLFTKFLNNKKTNCNLRQYKFVVYFTCCSLLLIGIAFSYAYTENKLGNSSQHSLAPQTNTSNINTKEEHMKSMTANSVKPEPSLFKKILEHVFVEYIAKNLIIFLLLIAACVGAVAKHFKWVQWVLKKTSSNKKKMEKADNSDDSDIRKMKEVISSDDPAKLRMELEDILIKKITGTDMELKITGISEARAWDTRGVVNTLFAELEKILNKKDKQSSQIKKLIVESLKNSFRLLKSKDKSKK